MIKRLNNHNKVIHALKIAAFTALLALMFALGGRIVSTTDANAQVAPTASPANIQIDEMHQALCYRSCSLIR